MLVGQLYLRFSASYHFSVRRLHKRHNSAATPVMPASVGDSATVSLKWTADRWIGNTALLLAGLITDSVILALRVPQIG